MSNRLPVPPSRTSVSRRRVAKLYSTTPNNPNGNTNSKSSVSRPIPLKIKKEAPDDEIKEYAASAMSEFLGLYGYEKVDSGCTRGLNLDHFVSSASSKQHSSRTLTRSLASKTIASNSPISTNPSVSPHSRSSRSPPTNISVISIKENSGPPTSSPLSLQTGLASPRAHENSDSASDSPDGATMCSWCGRAEGTWEPGGACVTYGKASSSGQFCSESCFAAGRRAAFKRARTCDWCRHVRPSMSYTDFQDGDNQLQFCSQKCLNQYKMNIFCRETQAHLALHGLNNTISSTNLGTGNLITPELWYRDCISPTSRSEELIVDDDPVTRSSSIHDDDESLNQEEENKRETNNKCTKDKNSFRIRDIARRGKNEEDMDVRVDEDENVMRIRKNSEKEDEPRRQNEQFMEQIRFQFPAENLSKFGTSISPMIRDRSKNYVNSTIQDSGSSHELEGFSRETLIIKDTSESIHKENSRGRRNIRYGITKPKKSSKSPTWASEQSTPTLSLMANSTPRIVLPQHTPFKFPTHLGMHPGRPLLVRPPMIPLRPQIPLNSPSSSSSSTTTTTSSSSSSLLPPVTVLVPYPIPIPIPIPIPLPIPMFSKLLKENGDLSMKDEKVSGTSIPEDLSKRKVSTSETKEPPEVSEIIKPPSPSTSDLQTTKIYSNETVEAKVKPICLTSKNSRPSRKRRRNPETSEEIEIQLKRKMSV